jgi:hypothetical protein
MYRMSIPNSGSCMLGRIAFHIPIRYSHWYQGGAASLAFGSSDEHTGPGLEKDEVIETKSPTRVEPAGVPHSYRPARALLGFMTAEEACLSQAGRNQQEVTQPEFVEKAALARAAAAVRPEVSNQEGLLTAAPAELASHLNALKATGAATAFFAEGWEVRLADLRGICAIQPHVFTDSSEERIEGAGADLLSVAQVSLQIPRPEMLPAQFDQVRQAWVFSSGNPNLRIAGNWAGPISEGVAGFGFVVHVNASFMQVADFRGRLLLRDGYHRAYGFLSKGITHVPVFFKRFLSIEELALPQGMLPQDSYFGPRPARLSDYLKDDVSSDVNFPASQKVIVIQGLEISHLG